MENPTLVSALLAAVPLQYAELGLPERFIEHTPDLGRIAGVLASKGDVLLFGGGKRGDVAAIFNDVAKGIAVLSCVPGGVKVFGLTWTDGMGHV